MKKEQQEITTLELKKLISKSNEDLARMMANGFSSLQGEIQRLDQIVLATRQDILGLHDKFIHRREFDELSLRVSKIEEKVRK